MGVPPNIVIGFSLNSSSYWDTFIYGNPPIEKLSKNPPGPHRNPLLAAAFLDLPLQLRSSLGRLILQVILQGRRGATRQLFARDLDADPTTLRARALPECEKFCGKNGVNMGKSGGFFRIF